MPNEPRLVISNDRFVLDGEPHTVRSTLRRVSAHRKLRVPARPAHVRPPPPPRSRPGRPSAPQILAGCIHYFRVHPELWSDRLARLRAMGLNTIQTCALRERRRGPWPAPPAPPAAPPLRGSERLRAVPRRRAVELPRGTEGRGRFGFSVARSLPLPQARAVARAQREEPFYCAVLSFRPGLAPGGTCAVLSRINYSASSSSCSCTGSTCAAPLLFLICWAGAGSWGWG
jgi:hypothetical protein